MTRLIIPAISALLFAGFPAQAHYSQAQSLQIALNFNRGDRQAPDMSAVSPHDNDQAGGDDAKDRKGRGHKGRSGDAGTQGDAAGGATTGGAAATAGAHVDAAAAPDDKGRG